KTTNANSKVFQVNGLTGANAQDLSKDFRPGTYRVSFWGHQQYGLEIGTKLKLNNVMVPVSETVSAGCWTQFNYYVNLAPNSSIDLFVSNSNGLGFYYDDFRMHPVYASMN